MIHNMLQPPYLPIHTQTSPEAALPFHPQLPGPRTLDSVEIQQIQKAKSRWFSKIQPGNASLLYELLASPFKAAIKAGVMAGSGTGTATLSTLLATTDLSRAAMLLISAGAATIAATGLSPLAYFNQRKQNENIEYWISALPKGANLGMKKYHPINQLAEERKHRLETSRQFAAETISKSNLAAK